MRIIPLAYFAVDVMIEFFLFPLSSVFSLAPRRPVASVSDNAKPDFAAVWKLPTSEIKAELSARGVQCASCSKKADWVRVLRNHWSTPKLEAPTFVKLMSLSLSELQGELGARGLHCAGCSGKEEHAQLLRTHWHAPKMQSSSRQTSQSSAQSAPHHSSNGTAALHFCFVFHIEYDCAMHSLRFPPTMLASVQTATCRILEKCQLAT